MTATREVGAVSGLDTLEGGDHVAWFLDRAADFATQAGRFFQQGMTCGDKLLMFAPQRCAVSRLPIGDGVTVFDPRKAFLADSGRATVRYRRFGSVLREQKALASTEGYRGVRLIVDMDWLLDSTVTHEDVIELELGLDEATAAEKALVVCAYRLESFTAAEIADAACVHPGTLNDAPGDVGFRMWAVSSNSWHLSGEIDLRARSVFPALLTSAARGRERLRLDCAGLDFIDAAGTRAIAHVACETATPLHLEHASDSLRSLWRLLDLEAYAPKVDLRP
ncbi:MEDS domain-containing protein [Actinospica sp.]|uniref:MEDS domain-containing protein n=1 Tax=Actinospica sp. TaxID=1872142 RepID=UPI002B89A7AB|nr:MEDS domain-containing protein [Actinospica sp.]HWG22511.1 MEDS domain-containing protein [Actinospica sp.]